MLKFAVSQNSFILNIKIIQGSHEKGLYKKIPNLWILSSLCYTRIASKSMPLLILCCCCCCVCLWLSFRAWLCWLLAARWKFTITSMRSTPNTSRSTRRPRCTMRWIISTPHRIRASNSIIIMRFPSTSSTRISTWSRSPSRSAAPSRSWRSSTPRPSTITTTAWCWRATANRMCTSTATTRSQCITPSTTSTTRTTSRRDLAKLSA